MLKADLWKKMKRSLASANYENTARRAHASSEIQTGFVRGLETLKRQKEKLQLEKTVTH